MIVQPILMGGGSSNNNFTKVQVGYFNESTSSINVAYIDSGYISRRIDSNESAECIENKAYIAMYYVDGMKPSWDWDYVIEISIKDGVLYLNEVKIPKVGNAIAGNT